MSLTQHNRPSGTMTGGRALAEMLRLSGAGPLFGMGGFQLLPFYDAVGLVGLGAVGRALRWRLEGLGMQVLAYDPYAEDATSSLEELLAGSDVVSMHAPVNPETAGMIGADQFAAMRDGVVFINTARAQLHDTDALVAALASGKVGAAGLDHFVGENLAVDHPLTGFANVVLTPHIGGATYNTEANHTSTVADDLERLLGGGTPLNIVNPEVLSGDKASR